MRTAPNRFLPYAVIFIFAFVLYGNTLSYDYTLDDLIVIKENAFTKKGIAGIGDIFSYDSFTGFFGTEKKLVEGGRYRPLSIATFAVEYSLAGGLNPALSHLVNILLYALTGMMIFLLLSKLFKPPANRPWFLTLPFITAMIFMAHPVHTEVVANIKGRDELLALLLPLTALWMTLHYFERKRVTSLLGANLMLFLGILSKENAILFAVVIPLTIYFFTGVPLRKNLTAGASFLFTALLFVIIRFMVLGYLNSGELPRELMNNPFLEATPTEKIGTILYTLGLYIKLLFFPYPLTHDYYPYHIPLVDIANWRALLSLAIYLAMAGYALYRFRAKDIIAYGILFYLLTLFIVSNLLFPVGTFMNERFIYMPSLGFALVAASLLAGRLPLLLRKPGAYRTAATGILAVVLVLFTITTVARNRVWKDNFTLFTTDVLVSENSVKCNVSAGGDLQKMAENETDPAKKAEYYERSIRHLEKAISIYPKTANGLLLYGNVLALYRNDYKQSVAQYMRVLEFEPNNRNALSNSLKVLGSVDSRNEKAYKLGVLKTLYNMNPDYPGVNYALGKLYGQFFGKPDSAAWFLERAVSLDPSDAAAYKDLGIVYSMQGRYDLALDRFFKARQLDPSDQQVLQNIMITRQIMGGRKP